MIIGISDGVKMTNIVGRFNHEEAKKHYQNFYCKHHEILIEKWSECDWKLCKTTGDGLFFYAENGNYDYSNFLNSIIDLHKKINDVEQPSRLFIYYCNSSTIVRGEELEDNRLKSFIEKDLFGHELNIGFRLLGLVTGNFLFTDDSFLEKVYPNDVKKYPKQIIAKSGVSYLPIPVTYLKGINEIGFRSQNYIDPLKNIGVQKNPRWIWEIRY